MDPRIRETIILACIGILIVSVGALAARHWTLVRVAGASMHPALHPGDLVLVDCTAGVGVGDIVLVRGDTGERYLHRVRRLLGDGAVVLRGDANMADDRQPVRSGGVVGPAGFVIPVGVLVERWRAMTGCATLAAQQNSNMATTETTSGKVSADRDGPQD